MKWDKIPYWSERLLQGTAFWIGYKTQLFKDYPLTEGAIVGEAVSLITGALKEGYTLECEIMYKNLNVNTNRRTRADLVIKKGDYVDSIIEVKRANSANKKIEDDLKRLSNFHKTNPDSRCFLLLVSQKFRPYNYINPNGLAIHKENHTNDYVAKVRRACKAATSFKSKSKAHYSCLIEILYKYGK